MGSAAGVGHRDRRVLRVLLGELHGVREELLVGDDLGDKAHLKRSLGIDDAAAEGHLLCAFEADEAREEP